MKMNQLVKAAAVVIALAVAAPSVWALSPAQKTAIKKAVTSVAPPEIPAAAADLVVNAAKEDREAVAVEAVRVAIYKNRSVAPAVVAAVSKVAPDLAAVVAMNATQLERAQVGAIASAAIAAAPAARADISTSAKSAYVASSMAAVNLSPVSASPLASAPVSITAGGGVASMAPVGLSSGFSMVRGGASQQGGITFTQTSTPINPVTGGAGDGTYNGAGTVAGTSVPYDYSQPRHF